MKKTHWVLLTVSVLMFVFSTYSLAAMNKVYRIEYEWYSQYSGKFTRESRDLGKDKWEIQQPLRQIRFGIAGEHEELPGELLTEKGLKKAGAADFNRFVFIYGLLEKVSSPEYRIRFLDIAQRGNVVEILFNVNYPPKSETPIGKSVHEYIPMDIIRIDKSAFPEKGDLLFVFKNQKGKQQYKLRYKIKYR
jgi:hypothetical protein